MNIIRNFETGRRFEIDRHGHGLAYTIRRCTDGAEAFLQGEDAVLLEGDIESAQQAHTAHPLVVADPIDHVCADYEQIMGGDQAQ